MKTKLTPAQRTKIWYHSRRKIGWKDYRVIAPSEIIDKLRKYYQQLQRENYKLWEVKEDE